MIYSIAIAAPNTRRGRVVFFAAPTVAAALAKTQALAHALNQVQPTLVAGPSHRCASTAELLGNRDGLGGPDNFDPLLLADEHYRMGYRKARIAIAGVHGLTAREQFETLPS